MSAIQKVLNFGYQIMILYAKTDAIDYHACQRANCGLIERFGLL
jgi:hypothetical protein